MALITDTIINVSQALVDIPALNNSTTLAIQSQGGTEGELGSTNPTSVGITNTPLAFDCDGQFVTCIIRLFSDSVDPLYFSALTAGEITVTVNYDDPLIPPSIAVIDLATLQSQGDVSEAEIGLFSLPSHIRSGGRTRISQPIAFTTTRTNVGNFETVCASDYGTSLGFRAEVGGASTTPDPDASDRSTAIGSGALVTDQSAQALSIGYNSVTTNNSSRCVVVGYEASSFDNAGESVVIGDGAYANTNARGCVVLGYFAECVSDVEYSIAIGSNSLVSSGSQRSIAIGRDCSVITTSTDTVCIGYGANGTLSASSVIVGTRASARQTTPRTVVMGYEADSQAGHGVVIGYQATNTSVGSTYSVVMGSTATLVNTSQHAVVMGVRATITGAGSDRSIVIGLDSISTGGNPDSVIIGQNASASANSHHSVILGSGSFASQGSAYAVVIGYQASITNAVADTSVSSIAIGTQSTTQSPYSIVISTEISSIDDLSSQAIAIGNFLTVVNSPGGVAFGQNVNLTNAARSTIIGQNSVITGADYSLSIGPTNVIGDPGSAGASNDNAHVIIGADNRLGAGTDGSLIFGINNLVAGGSNLILGRSNTVSNQAVRIAGNNSTCEISVVDGAFLIGHHIDASTNPASGSVSLGYGAVAAAQTLTIGSSTALALGASAIRTFNVRGYNGGALDTIAATDNPAAANQVGLSLVLNTGAGFANKDIFGEVTPPVGSLLLHVAS